MWAARVLLGVTGVAALRSSSVDHGVRNQLTVAQKRRLKMLLKARAFELTDEEWDDEEEEAYHLHVDELADEEKESTPTVGTTPAARAEEDTKIEEMSATLDDEEVATEKPEPERDLGDPNAPIETKYSRTGCYQFRTEFDKAAKKPTGINKHDYGDEVLPGSDIRKYRGPMKDDMTTETCFAYCSEYKKDNPSFNYFALYKEHDPHSGKGEFFDRCICLPFPPAKNVSEDYCGMPCNANQDQMCGGVCREIVDKVNLFNANVKTKK